MGKLKISTPILKVKQTLNSMSGFTNKEIARQAGKKSSRAGTPNKVTGEARECFQLLIDNNAPRLQQWIDEVAKDNPAKALDLFLRLAEFIVPKLQRTEIIDHKENERYVTITAPKWNYIDAEKKQEQ